MTDVKETITFYRGHTEAECMPPSGEITLRINETNIPCTYVTRQDGTVVLTPRTRAVPIKPTPDLACIEAGHVIPNQLTAGEWIDTRTWSTGGCPRCATFWGDTRDAT